MEIIRVSGHPIIIQHLAVKEVFQQLSDREKLYAHHISRAAWHGSRIIMRQVSPEATGIFDFIVALYKSCGGKWEKLVGGPGVTNQELAAFLEYAGHFLYNIGNYWGEGDRKFVPDLSAKALRSLLRASIAAKDDPDNLDVLYSLNDLETIIEPMISGPPFVLGYPSECAQSTYYPGDEKITKEEISLVSKVLENHGIEPENTRLQKVVAEGHPIFEVLQASTNDQFLEQWDRVDGLGTVRIRGGDHASELTKVCQSLRRAREYTENETQIEVIDQYIRNFETGNMQSFRDAQKAWVKDKAPIVENIIGFAETYRDPHGVRGEWEGFVGISDPTESLKMRRLVDHSITFIRLLPWAISDVNDGKGPFEKDVFVAPDYTSSYSLAFCTSYAFEATNVPNYNDIRETCGFKNIVVANRMNTNNSPLRPCYYIHDSDVGRYRECTHIIRFITTTIHEVLGHGSGKLLSEISPGHYNFDVENPPISPLTGQSIETWYRPGQTWTSVFGTIATSVEECRAMLVPLYLIDNAELLSIFGYDDKTDITADELHYNTYLQIGVEGLQGLAYYNSDQKSWGQAHKRAHWAILKHLLLDGGGVLSVVHDVCSERLTVKVDRSKMLSHGKPSLGRLLCRIHIWRCTADVKPCSEYYEEVTSITEDHEAWRQHVARKPEPRWKFVHANTFLNNKQVTIKEYASSNEGIIQSWVERNI
ncbi:dipeptidyl peptidase III [Xylaria curta]|nr:dipeptidyl peptidase III [Xylaria curta]